MGIKRMLRRVFRRRVAAGVGNRRGPGEAGGSAGVREPRRPKPTGPPLAQGTKPEPDPGQTMTLPDPRQ
ncbi:hypothetical protein GCM10029964_021230 [Kibdelosporangium lantanae]